MSKVQEITPQPVQQQGNISRVYIQPQSSYLVQSNVRPVIISSPSRNQNQQQQNEDDEEILDEEAKKDKRVVNLLILLLPFIIAVLFLIASIRLVHRQLHTEKSLDGADNVLDFVHHNLHSDPVISWRTTTTNTCPNDYQEAHIGKWQGINRGCLCKNGDAFVEESYLECLSFKDNGCSYQKSYDSEHFHNWVDQNVEFCEKTLDSKKWEKVAHCDTSVNTYCGASVCIKGQNAQCPPNVLEVSKLTDPSAAFGSLLKQFGDKVTSNESSVTVRRQSDQTPPAPAIDVRTYFQKDATPTENTAFVALHISQGTSVCLNSNYARTDNLLYHLDVQQTQNHVCDQYGALTSEQVYELDTTFQNIIYHNNKDLQQIYTQANLVDYNAADYEQNDYHLLAIQKINVANKKECNAAFGDHLSDSAKLARSSRTVLRVFSWVLFAFTIVTVLLGVVFVLAALFKKISNEHDTKVKVARFYWFSAWFLVTIAFLIFLYYHVFFTTWLGDNEDQLSNLKAQNCFPSNGGINIAISKLITFDQETAEKFGPIVNEIFWYGVVYSLIWMAVIAFWKNKYSQVKSFINNE